MRNSLKVLMAVLALAGITGMYLSQVRRNGVLGLIGFLLLGASYVLIACMTYLSAFVLPPLVATDPAYVDDVAAQIKGGDPRGEIGPLALAIQVQDIGFLAGGLVLGLALFRARILARWASLLLAVGGLVTIVLSVMPDAFYRLLAFPNGIAMIGLGISLWRSTRTSRGDTETSSSTKHLPRMSPAGAE